MRARADVFSPFCTRPFAKAAFSVPALFRLNEHVHYRLLQHLSPELHGMPFEKPWLPQTRTGMYAQRLPVWALERLRAKLVKKLGSTPNDSTAKPGRSRNRAELLESRLDSIRSLCLDQESSPVWQLLDRGGLENLLAPLGDASLRRRQYKTILKVATLFSYTATASRRFAGTNEAALAGTGQD